jgi:hypothetical protein
MGDEPICEVCDHEFAGHDRSQGCVVVVGQFAWGLMYCDCFNAPPAPVLSGQPEAVVESNRERIEASIAQGEAEAAAGELTSLDEALSGQPEVDR